MIVEQLQSKYNANLERIEGFEAIIERSKIGSKVYVESLQMISICASENVSLMAAINEIERLRNVLAMFADKKNWSVESYANDDPECEPDAPEFGYDFTWTRGWNPIEFAQEALNGDNNVTEK